MINSLISIIALQLSVFLSKHSNASLSFSAVFSTAAVLCDIIRLQSDFRGENEVNIRGQKAVIFCVYIQKGRQMKQGLRIIIRDLVSDVRICVFNGLSGKSGCADAALDYLGRRLIAIACVAILVLIGPAASAKANICRADWFGGDVEQQHRPKSIGPHTE